MHLDGVRARNLERAAAGRSRTTAASGRLRGSSHRRDRANLHADRCRGHEERQRGCLQQSRLARLVQRSDRRSGRPRTSSSASSKRRTPRAAPCSRLLSCAEEELAQQKRNLLLFRSLIRKCGRTQIAAPPGSPHQPETKSSGLRGGGSRGHHGYGRLLRVTRNRCRTAVTLRLSADEQAFDEPHYTGSSTGCEGHSVRTLLRTKGVQLCPTMSTSKATSSRNLKLLFGVIPSGRGPAGTFATGGAGSGAPHLQSQGCVVPARERRHLLVTNAGSGDLSVFETGEEDDIALDTTPAAARRGRHQRGPRWLS